MQWACLYNRSHLNWAAYSEINAMHRYSGTISDENGIDKRHAVVTWWHLVFKSTYDNWNGCSSMICLERQRKPEFICVEQYVSRVKYYNKN